MADLDAIAGTGDHGAVVQAIAALGLSVWLDAGVATADDARRAVSRGAARVIVGTETLRDVRDLAGDRRGGARAPAGAGRTASSAWTIATAGSSADRPRWPGPRRPSWRPRPGRRASGRSSCSISPGSARGTGPETEPARQLRARLPDAEIVLGGGVRGQDDLRALARAGYQAAWSGRCSTPVSSGPRT